MKIIEQFIIQNRISLIRASINQENKTQTYKIKIMQENKKRIRSIAQTV